MANFMYVLRPEETKYKVVCPACTKRGEVTNFCPTCHGSGVKTVSTVLFSQRSRPIQIEKVDRDPKTGILRYWENKSEFFYETTTHELNKNIPDVPYGVHLCHDTSESAHTECDRINRYLKNKSTMKKLVENLPSVEDAFGEIMKLQVKGITDSALFHF